jgi:hypothetical protein
MQAVDLVAEEGRVLELAVVGDHPVQRLGDPDVERAELVQEAGAHGRVVVERGLHEALGEALLRQQRPFGGEDARRGGDAERHLATEHECSEQVVEHPLTTREGRLVLLVLGDHERLEPVEDLDGPRVVELGGQPGLRLGARRVDLAHDVVPELPELGVALERLQHYEQTVGGDALDLLHRRPGRHGRSRPEIGWAGRATAPSAGRDRVRTASPAACAEARCRCRACPRRVRAGARRRDCPRASGDRPAAPCRGARGSAERSAAGACADARSESMPAMLPGTEH